MPMWMRHHEAAGYIGVSVWTLAQMRASGEGPVFYRLGRRLIGYRRDDLDAWLQARRCLVAGDSTSSPIPQASLERTLPALEETVV